MIQLTVTITVTEKNETVTEIETSGQSNLTKSERLTGGPFPG